MARVSAPDANSFAIRNKLEALTRRVIAAVLPIQTQAMFCQ
jgi:hypothetical protein